MIIENKRLIGIVLTVVFLLLVPLVGMQFTNEVNWNLSDFAVAGLLLLGTSLIYELVMRKIKKTNNRIILCAIILVALLLIWIELAVGLIGTTFAGS